VTRERPRVVLIMGVAGSGKSTVGAALAWEIAAEFLEADDFHSEENVARMRSGMALTDEDRGPWLHRLRAAIEYRVARGFDVVVACSALKRAYRKILLGGASLKADAQVVFLHGAPEVLRARLAARRDHFAGPELLDSQLAALEPPPRAIEFDVSRPADEIVAELAAQFGPTS